MTISPGLESDKGHFEGAYPSELPKLPPHENFNGAELLLAVKSFPKASASGGSAFSPTHLLELSRVPEGRRTQSLNGVLLKAVSLLAAGEAPSDIGPWLCAAPVTPLRKRNDGVRPIAVGETIRRLVGKMRMRRMKDRAISHLTESQVVV